MFSKPDAMTRGASITSDSMPAHPSMSRVSRHASAGYPSAPIKKEADQTIELNLKNLKKEQIEKLFELKIISREQAQNALANCTGDSTLLSPTSTTPARAIKTKAGQGR